MRRVVGLCVVAALVLAGVAAGVLAPGSGAAAKSSKATVKITVSATEFKFKLTKLKVAAGTTVAFKVVNRGKISHDFKINKKKTKSLLPGQSQTIVVKFTKKGKYAFLCTIPGHASAGMKGVFGVGVAAGPQPTVSTTTTTTTTPPPTTTGTVGTGNTTVQVGMFEYRFELSQTTVPSGQVTFVITNKGSEVHNFSVSGVHQGKLLSPGQSETYTVGLPAGQYGYVCDVPFHIDRGMTGSLTVTQ